MPPAGTSCSSNTGDGGSSERDHPKKRSSTSMIVACLSGKGTLKNLSAASCSSGTPTPPPTKKKKLQWNVNLQTTVYIPRKTKMTFVPSSPSPNRMVGASESSLDAVATPPHPAVAASSHVACDGTVQAQPSCSVIISNLHPHANESGIQNFVSRNCLHQVRIVDVEFLTTDVRCTTTIPTKGGGGGRTAKVTLESPGQAQIAMQSLQGHPWGGFEVEVRLACERDDCETSKRLTATQLGSTSSSSLEFPAKVPPIQQEHSAQLCPRLNQRVTEAKVSPVQKQQQQQQQQQQQHGAKVPRTLKFVPRSEVLHGTRQAQPGGGVRNSGSERQFSAYASESRAAVDSNSPSKMKPGSDFRDHAAIYITKIPTCTTNEELALFFTNRLWTGSRRPDIRHCSIRTARERTAYVEFDDFDDVDQALRLSWKNDLQLHCRNIFVSRWKRQVPPFAADNFRTYHPVQTSVSASLSSGPVQKFEPPSSSSGEISKDLPQGTGRPQCRNECLESDNGAALRQSSMSISNPSETKTLYYSNDMNVGQEASCRQGLSKDRRLEADDEGKIIQSEGTDHLGYSAGRKSAKESACARGGIPTDSNPSEVELRQKLARQGNELIKLRREVAELTAKQDGEVKLLQAQVESLQSKLAESQSRCVNVSMSLTSDAQMMVEEKRELKDEIEAERLLRESAQQEERCFLSMVKNEPSNAGTG